MLLGHTKLVIHVSDEEIEETMEGDEPEKPEENSIEIEAETKSSEAKIEEEEKSTKVSVNKFVEKPKKPKFSTGKPKPANYVPVFRTAEIQAVRLVQLNMFSLLT